MTASAELATRLSNASVKKAWDVYSAFDWPEKLDPVANWYMSPELISIYGTELWNGLSETEQKRLSFYEIINFFSFVLYGERPLIQGMTGHLYRKSTQGPISDYLHHFIDEENKHMIMFGMFCNRYAGQVYPEKKIVMPREYAKGEEEVAFFCKVLVVEELGDYYNLKMMSDKSIDPLVAQINKVHHVDEARHLSFGRLYLSELAADICPKWTAEERTSFENWLVAYIDSSWGDFYNPAMYKDAGLPNAYNVRKAALADPICREARVRASAKLVDYFLSADLLSSRPQH